MENKMVEQVEDFKRRGELCVAPRCHMTPMELHTADDWPNGQVTYWECKHCGHTIEYCEVLLFNDSNVNPDPLGKQTLPSKTGVVQVGSRIWLGVIL
jgi:hypothetical protein